jgi:phage tail sheath protein FI
VAVTCNNAVDFATQLGYSAAKGADGTWVYPACEVYDAMFIENNASPLVVINVFDPWTMSTKVSASYDVKNLEVAIPAEVILPSLEVTGTGGKVYTKDTDFSFAYDDNTLQSATLTVFAASAMASETAVTCAYSTPNLANITQDTIIGGVDPVTGALTGMEVLEHVPTDTGIIPAQFIAPGWSHLDEVCAAGIARSESISNGRYRAVFIADIDTTASGVTNYTQLYKWKNDHNFVSDFLISGWPLFTLGEKTYHFSTIYATAHNITAAAYGNIPFVVASNKHNIAFDGMVLSDKSRVRNDLSTMDYIENQGLISGVNDDGWTLIGDYTTDYPGHLQPYEMWTCERFMFNFLGNTLTRTLKSSIDLPGNMRTLASIGETIQQYLNHLVAVQAANTARVIFDPAKNLAQQVESGIYTFTILWTPPTPVRQLKLELTYSVEDLAIWISMITIPTTATSYLPTATTP